MTHSNRSRNSGGHLVTFTQELASASTTEAVVALANRYLAELQPELLDRFPARCRPERIDDEEALHRWRRQLLAEVCTLPATPDLRLQELAVFFLRASARVHALESRPEITSARGPVESAVA